jgi:hypothetical protein
LETGEVLTQEEVEDLVDEIIDGIAGDDLASLVTALEEGRITVAQWMSDFALLLVALYILLALLGRARRDELSFVSVLLIFQFDRLENLARQIADGQLTAGEVRRRSGMYVNSARQAYWSARDRDARRRGMVEERWGTMGDKNVCNPCTEAEMMGFQRLGTFAQPGSGRVMNSPMTFCIGLANCRCRKFYR